MIEQLVILLLNAFWVFGLRVSFENGNILGALPRWWINTFGKYQFAPLLAKPLFFCAPCMASAWGWFGFQFIVDKPIEWILYPVWVVLLAGLNSIISRAWKY